VDAGQNRDCATAVDRRRPLRRKVCIEICQTMQDRVIDLCARRDLCIADIGESFRAQQLFG
jgi:hypothetical protein